MADDQSKSRPGLDSHDCVFCGGVPALGVVQPREKTGGAVRLESLSRNVLQFQLPLSPSKKMPDNIMNLKNLSLVDDKKTIVLGCVGDFGHSDQLQTQAVASMLASFCFHHHLCHFQRHLRPVWGHRPRRQPLHLQRSQVERKCPHCPHHRCER